MGESVNRLEKYFPACCLGQSEYALTHLVTGGQLTPHRRFRQAVLESHVLYKNLKDSEYRKEEILIDIEELECKLNGFYENHFDRKRDDLKLRRKRVSLEELDKSVEHQARELSLHTDMLDKYEQELGITGDEDQQQIRDMIEAHEGDHYATKLAMDIAAQVVQSQGGPHQGITLALQQLPEEDLQKAATIVTAMIPQMMANKYTDALHSPEGVEALERLGEQLKMVSNNQPENVRSLK